MLLVRYKNKHDPKIVFEGSEKEVIKEIHKLNLCDWHDAFFYERGKFENLGLGNDVYDYYKIHILKNEIKNEK